MLDVLVGLQWGDEGKGKIVDRLTPGYDIIARFQGGPNAGHTLVINGKKFVLHTIPSGIINAGTENVIGTGLVIDPVTIMAEIDMLEKEQIEVTSRLFISDKAHLILPTHRALDKYYELSKGEGKIGSTLRGIGPAYQDKYARTGPRIGDIKSSDFQANYEELKQFHFAILKTLGCPDPQEEIAEYEAKWLVALDRLRQLHIEAIEYRIQSALANGKKVLAEGAQGTLLDISFGSYPFVTSSNTISASACIGLGVAPQTVKKVYGVFKAYMTRVGSGPFPTELFNEEGKTLMTVGHEYGSTTGRERRCGWLDLQLLDQAIKQNGVTDLIMMKSDVLSSLKEFCVLDVKGDKRVFPAWKSDISNIKNYDELPIELRNYIDFIEAETGVSVSIVSLGPGRDETIIR